MYKPDFVDDFSALFDVVPSGNTGAIRRPWLLGCQPSLKSWCWAVALCSDNWGNPGSGWMVGGWLVDGWWPCCVLGEFDIDLMNIETHADREKHFGNMSYRYWNSTGHFAVCPSCFQWHPAVERAVASQAPAWYLSRWYLKVRVWATFWSSLTDQRFMSFSPLVISLFVHKL